MAFYTEKEQLAVEAVRANIAKKERQIERLQRKLPKIGLLTDKIIAKREIEMEKANLAELRSNQFRHEDIALQAINR